VRLDREVYQDTSYSAFINEHFISIKVNGQEGDGKKYKEKFKVRGYPTVLFFQTDGMEIDRVCGYDGNKAAFYQTMVDYVNGKNTLSDFLTRLATIPYDVKANYRVAKRYTDRWELEEAQPYFKRILELDPQDTHGYDEESHGYIAVNHLNITGDDQPMIDLLNLSDNKIYLKQGYDVLIRHYRRKEMPDKLLWVYEQAVSRLPENADFMNAYAWHIYEQKLTDRYDRGLELARQAVQIKPEAAYIWDTLAWLEYEKGLIDQAMTHMKKAVELAPGQEGYQKNLKKLEEAIKSQ